MPSADLVAEGQALSQVRHRPRRVSSTKREVPRKAERVGDDFPLAEWAQQGQALAEEALCARVVAPLAHVLSQVHKRAGEAVRVPRLPQGRQALRQ